MALKRQFAVFGAINNSSNTKGRLGQISACDVSAVQAHSEKVQLYAQD